MSNLSKGREVVLQLEPRAHSRVTYLDCSWLSDFPNEHEHILCGGLGTVRIENVYSLRTGTEHAAEIRAMQLLAATVRAQPPPALPEDATELREVGEALNDLMMSRMQAAPQGADVGSGDDAKDAESEPGAGGIFMQRCFAEMCEYL